MTSYDLRAAEGLQYPGDFGTQYLIINDPADPLANPEYAGEADSLELALLFAASPDLLAACEAYVAAYEDCLANPSSRVHNYRPLVDAMQAAVAKAKGESGD